uniref:Uncharacterized protein n=1 Tax=Cucumis melo TaxID=3656 RepID=A0A9I9EKQ8_CUCME
MFLIRKNDLKKYIHKFYNAQVKSRKPKSFQTGHHHHSPYSSSLQSGNGGEKNTDLPYPNIYIQFNIESKGKQRKEEKQNITSITSRQPYTVAVDKTRLLLLL